jgi:hypothetical protein
MNAKDQGHKIVENPVFVIAVKAHLNHTDYTTHEV